MTRDELAYEISGVIDAAVYGGLEIPPATSDIMELINEYTSQIPCCGHSCCCNKPINVEIQKGGKQP